MARDGLKSVPCDKCGEPVVLGVDLVYTIADKWDDDGKLISARHGRCQPSQAEFRRQTDEAFAKVKAALGRMRTSMATLEQGARGPPPKAPRPHEEPFEHEVKRTD
jgi:hypothetical protein